MGWLATEGPLLARSARVDDMRPSAAKDRTFKIVHPNQEPAPERRRSRLSQAGAASARARSGILM